MRKQMKRNSTYWWALEMLEARRMLSSTDLLVSVGSLPSDIPTGYLLNVPVTVTNNRTSRCQGRCC